MKHPELMRIETASEGLDVVVEIEGDLAEGEVWLVLDHHGNGTSERARLDMQALLKLRGTLGTLVRLRAVRSRVKPVKVKP